MFSVNRLPCTGHSLSGPWGSESLVNSVVVKPVRKPRGQSSLCDLPRPRFWAQGKPSLTNSTGKGQAPGGDCGFQDTSLFPVLCPSFLQWVDASGASGTHPPNPYSKQRFQDIPWRLSGELPPQPPAQRPCSAPQLRASCSQIIQRVPCRWENTLSLRLRVCRCLPSGLFLLTWQKVEVYCALCIIKHNMIHIYPERRVLSGLCLVTGGNGGGSPFSWKLTATFPFEISVLVFLFHPESSLMNLPTFVQISTCDLTWLKKATDKKFKTELRVKAKIKTFLT